MDFFISQNLQLETPELINAMIIKKIGALISTNKLRNYSENVKMLRV
jgi:hypothetical protein